jgi:hypothetical protein
MTRESKDSFQNGFTFQSGTIESTESLSSQQGHVNFTSQTCHYQCPPPHAADSFPVASFAQRPDSQSLASIPFDRVNSPILESGITDCPWVGYMDPNWDMDTNNLGFYPLGGVSLASTASMPEPTQRSKVPQPEQQNAHCLSSRMENPR